MENIIDVRLLTASHVARSVIVTRSQNRPKFLSDKKFVNICWPTPAQLTYETIVSKQFARCYWQQNSTNRKKLLFAVTKELEHEGRCRIYRRVERKEFLLKQLTFEEFERVIGTRLHNLRYQEPDINGTEFTFDFDSFAENEHILVEAPNNSVIYNGVFQFNSCINNAYCFIKFDSRSHVIRWKKEYVRQIRLDSARPKRTAKPTQHFINETSDRNNVTAASNNIDASATGIAMENSDYEELLARHGNGNENKQCLDESWLIGKGFVRNEVDNHPCVMCFEPIKLQDTVYNIECNGKLQHMFHKHCTFRYVVEQKFVFCPLCKESWIQ